MGSIRSEEFEIYGLKVEGKVHNCRDKSVCCLCPYCDKIVCTDCGGLGLFFEHKCDVMERVAGSQYFIYVDIDEIKDQ